MTQFMIDSRGSTIKPEGRLLLAVCPHIINIIDPGSMSLIHQLSYKALYRVEPPTRANRAITLRFRPKNAGDAPPVLKCTTVEEGQEKQLVMTIKKYQEYVWCSRATIISLSLSFVVLYEVCLRISIERFHFISTKLHYID